MSEIDRATPPTDLTPHTPKPAPKRRSTKRNKAVSEKKPPEPTRIETFLIANFGKLPVWMRCVTYALVLMAWLYNVLQDPTVRGQLFVKATADSSERPALSHIVEYGDADFSTNAQGRWVLRAPRLSWGAMKLNVYEPVDRRLIGAVDVCLPMPIVGAVLQSQQPRIVYREDRRELTVTPACERGTKVAAAAETRGAQSIANVRRLKIARIQLGRTGHSTSTAEVYFVILGNAGVVPTPALPSKKSKDSWLLLQDSKAADPYNLWFNAPVGQTIRIQLWDRDSKPFNADDLLAEFPVSVNSVSQQGLVLSDRHGTRLVLVPG